MAFEFRLTAVQKIRENRRDEQRFTLARAQRTVEEITAQLAALEAQAETLRQEKTRLLEAGGVVPFAAVQQFQRRQQWLSGEYTRVAAELEDARQDARACHDSLVEADREVKKLEKLEEKQRRQYAENAKKRRAG